MQLSAYFPLRSDFNTHLGFCSPSTNENISCASLMSESDGKMGYLEFWVLLERARLSICGQGFIVCVCNLVGLGLVMCSWGFGVFMG